MKKTVKVGVVSAAYQVLNSARYSKLTDSEKITLWKMLRSMKPVAVEFMDATRDAEEKMKTSEDMDNRLLLARKFENTQGKDSSMTAEEYFDFIAEYRRYRMTVDKLVRELSEKEVEIDFEPVNEETFRNLISSNDWTMEQVSVIGELITE